MVDRIQISCSKCGKRFAAPGELAGKKTRCPCGNTLEVPVPKPGPVPAPTAPEPAPPQRPAAEDIVRKWYYAKNRERFGPVPQSELVKLIKAGEVAGTDFVWTKELDAWQAAQDVELLKAGRARGVSEPNPAAAEAEQPALNGEQPAPETEHSPLDVEQPAVEEETAAAEPVADDRGGEEGGVAPDPAAASAAEDGQPAKETRTPATAARLSSRPATGPSAEARKARFYARSLSFLSYLLSPGLAVYLALAAMDWEIPTGVSTPEGRRFVGIAALAVVCGLTVFVTCQAGAMALKMLAAMRDGQRSAE